MPGDNHRGLTPQQSRFVSAYLVDLNGTKAALSAGYAKRSAGRQAWELLKRPHIAAELSKRQAKQMQNIGLTAEMVKDRLRILAFQDIRKFYDDQGNIIPVHELDDDAAAYLREVEHIRKNVEAGDGHTDHVIKMKTIDPVKPLEMLAKHFGLLIEQVDANVTHRFVHEMPEDAIEGEVVGRKQLPA